MSTGFGSGEGLRRTGGGLSNSSLSSTGSSLMTGGGTEPEVKSKRPSTPTDVLGVEAVLLRLGLLSVGCTLVF